MAETDSSVSLMTNTRESTLRRVLLTCCSPEECAELLRNVHVAASILEDPNSDVSRAVLSQALNLLLFHDLLARVPTGQDYVRDRVSQGRQILFDHGALRTVDLIGMGELPAGERAITRVLIPLGYAARAVYPLDRLGMTGRSYAHIEFPEELPQFFVSELHPDRFSPEFQDAVARVTGSSVDPLTEYAKRALEELQVRCSLPIDQAGALLPELLGCFKRQHATPHLRDYELILRESAEMAWIATEGNCFNHATDRVGSLDALVAEQRRWGRRLKDTIETSQSGRVRQTAFHADLVEREFIDFDGYTVRRTVPGSFYEFIQREQFHDPVVGQWQLDLAFDTASAQAIFKMTARA